MTTEIANRQSLWVDLLGAEVRFYDAGGVRTRSIECGNGETVIMLHGVGGHAESYARNVVPIGQHFNARSIDYYGHGLTDAGDLPFDKNGYVKHLLDFMDAAGIGRAHLIGESLGGWIAAWMAIEHPQRVGKVVYAVGAQLDVPIDSATQAKTDAGLAELLRLSKQFNNDPTRENVRARLSWLFHQPSREITEELIDLRWSLYQHAAGKPNPTARIGQQRYELNPETLARIARPTLFLWTDHNPSQQAATAKEAMRYVPDVEWALIESAGHWPQWEQTETFNRIVIDYLKR
jgi:2-hydroxy-6-oxonona-2,4-dienedioate hydrolase